MRRTRRHFLCGLALLLPAASFAATPERIVLTWDGDPSRTQAVTWWTSSPVSVPQAEIAVLTGSPKPGNTARKVKAVAEGPHYTARFENLEPATRYTYRVGEGETWSEWHFFRTASRQPEPFRFIYVGDAQNDIRSLWSRVIRAAYAAAPDARMILHAGDLVTQGWDDRLWSEWCEAMSFIGGTVPSLPVPGNHDLKRSRDDEERYIRAADPWHRHFALPLNGPEGLEEQSYYLDYQGVRFIAMDVNIYTRKIEPGSEAAGVAKRQLAWLEKILSGNPNRWTIILQHQGMYPIANERAFPQLQTMVMPLYDKYRVDLVLQGHDHAYARTHRLRGGKVAATREHGIVYVTSVSGPKMNDLTLADPVLMAKTLQDVQLYQIIDVNGDRLTYRAFTTDGLPADTFELRKAN